MKLEFTLWKGKKCLRMKKWMNVSSVNLKTEKRLFMHLWCIESATCIYHNKTTSCNTFCNALFFPPMKQFKAFLRSLQYLTVKRRWSLSYFVWKCQVRLPTQDRKEVLTWAPVLIVYYLIRGSSPPQVTCERLCDPLPLFSCFMKRCASPFVSKCGTVKKTNPSVFLEKSTLLRHQEVWCNVS